jgi:hypothetical protein
MNDLYARLVRGLFKRGAKPDARHRPGPRARSPLLGESISAADGSWSISRDGTRFVRPDATSV